MELRIINISKELHKQFKIAAAMNNQNMSDVIREFMKDYVNKNMKQAIQAPGSVKKKQPAVNKNMLMDESGNWIKEVKSCLK